MDALTYSTIVSLNVQSGGGPRATAICQSLDFYKPGVVVLTEWRTGVGSKCFLKWAASRGMSHASISGNLNGIFIAAREAFSHKLVTPEGAPLVF